jgi:hypothetical protein
LRDIVDVDTSTTPMTTRVLARPLVTLALAVLVLATPPRFAYAGVPVSNLIVRADVRALRAQQ